MADFEAKVVNAQQRLGRRLTAQELQLLQLWDAPGSQTDSHDVRGVAEQQDTDGALQEPHEERPSEFAVPSTRLKLVLLAVAVAIVFIVWSIYARAT